MRPIIDIEGMKFNHLRLQKRLRGDNRRVKCLCDCGRIAVKLIGNVKSGLTKTCGHKKCVYRN